MFGSNGKMNEFQIQRFKRSAVNIRYIKHMICAKLQNLSKDVDACQGDSGGLLIREVLSYIVI